MTGVAETWVPVGESWLGHRPEPLIHERVRVRPGATRLGGWTAPTDDFVAEHGEDIPPKRESVCAVNPPERAATWDARFPREDDDLGDQEPSSWCRSLSDRG